jgi:hypothetical protein
VSVTLINFLEYWNVVIKTDVILSPLFMEVVKAAIERNGLALARIPPEFEAELNRYEAQDPLKMIKFRAASHLPDRDSSRWIIIDVCLLLCHVKSKKTYTIS